MKKYFRKIVWFFISISILSLVACFHNETNKNTDDKINNTLYVDIGFEPPSLDPALAEDGYSYRIVNDLFAGLIDFDQTNRPIPGMATSWDISADGKTYTFHLRKDLKFSDGTPIKAKDFVYSWRRLINPKTGSAYNFLLSSVINGKRIINDKMTADNLGIKALDDYTFEVNLEYPNNAFLSYMTMPNLFVVPQKIIEKYGRNWTDPLHIITSGAYILKEHVLNGHILAEKNPNYYDAKNVSIEKIKYYPFVDTNVSISNYKLKTIDTSWQTVPVDRYQELKNKYPKELHTIQWERIEFLNFNLKLPKYAKSLKLRKALTMAIDREVLVKDVLKSGQIPLYSIVTPTIENGKYADVKYDWSSQSREKQIIEAKKLYNEAGYNINHPLTIILKYRNNDLYKKMSIAIAAMWREVLGVNVQLQNQEWKGLIQALHKGEFDIAQGGWGADFNSVTTYTSLFLCNNGNNNAHYCNKKYDNLVIEAEQTADINKQQELFKEAIKIAQDDYAVIPLFEPTHQRLVNPRVQGYDIEQNYLDNVQSKWFSLH